MFDIPHVDSSKKYPTKSQETRLGSLSVPRDQENELEQPLLICVQLQFGRQSTCTRNLRINLQGIVFSESPTILSLRFHGVKMRKLYNFRPHCRAGRTTDSTYTLQLRNLPVRLEQWFLCK